MLLPWLIFLPVIGGFLCWPSQRLGPNSPRWIALITIGITLILSLVMWSQGDYAFPVGKESEWTSEFIVSWIPRFGISFHLALDGLSILMVVLTALLGLLAVLCSWQEQHRNLGLFHLNMMWMCAGVIGVFTAIDLFLFFFFWEMMLLPMYFMIAVWGHRDSNNQSRFRGATKFLIYTQSSGLIMLVSILALAFDYNIISEGNWSFDYNDLLKTPLTSFSDSGVAEYVIMLGFFIAFAVKMPMFPLHGWLADAHAEAPTAGSVDISGLLLKTAAYGFLRFCIPIFPNASVSFAPIAMILGLISVFYGAWLAFAQTDMKRLIAYTSISHMGVVVIAIYSGSLLAYQGAVVQMIAHGLSAAGMFIICGQLYERLKTRDMRQMGGLWSRMNYLPAFALIFAVATLGMPGTGNFVGEFLMFFGIFSKAPIITIMATFGVVFASIYSLMYMQRSFYGPAKSDTPLAKLSLREWSILLLLVILLVLLGLYPQPILGTSYSTVNNIHQWLNIAIPTSLSVIGM